MASITPGTNPTISTDKLEEMTYALVEFGQAGEDNPTNNPKALTNLTSTINRDEKRINAVFNAPCAIAVSATCELTVLHFARGYKLYTFSFFYLKTWIKFFITDHPIIYRLKICEVGSVCLVLPGEQETSPKIINNPPPIPPRKKWTIVAKQLREW